MSAHILVVDDEPDICLLLQEILEDEGFDVSVADNAENAKKSRQEKRPDLILLDIWMPDMDGISLLKEWMESGMRDVPVVMMSGHGNVETAVEATRLGAYDFIEKPISLSKLLITVKRALEVMNLRRENKGLKQNSPVFEPLGHSKPISDLREHVTRMSHHDNSVLLIGEPGVGRTLFARYIHQYSHRKDYAFIDIRVSGMSPENQAIELFGSEGSDTVSRLQQADQGTLFIKDIADMDPAVQARLLSSLGNHAFVRNGGTQAIPINVRIIAATSYDPEHSVSAGRLREDLYYYLNIISMQVPPLREHCEDVPELLEYYVNRFVSEENLPYRRFTVATQNRLRNYHWPGNMRELKNLVQRLLILGGDDDIQVNEIEPTLNTQQRNSSNHNMPIFDLPLREAREQFERSYLEHQLQEAGGNVSKVATKVGLERTHLYRKLRALDIDPKQTKK
jgi:DNA-binding NtrC family response regulator